MPKPEPEPMTEDEFTETMDSLIAKGLIESGITANGELGIIPTPLAREVFAAMNEEAANGDSTNGPATTRTN